MQTRLYFPLRALPGTGGRRGRTKVSPQCIFPRLRWKGDGAPPPLELRGREFTLVLQLRFARVQENIDCLIGAGERKFHDFLPLDLAAPACASFYLAAAPCALIFDNATPEACLQYYCIGLRGWFFEKLEFSIEQYFRYTFPAQTNTPLRQMRTVWWINNKIVFHSDSISHIVCMVLNRFLLKRLLFNFFHKAILILNNLVNI